MEQDKLILHDILQRFRLETGMDAARLAELQTLTGCPIVRVIEGRCEEENCQNPTVLGMENPDDAAVFCARVQELVHSGVAPLAPPERPVASATQKPAAAPGPVIDITPRLRCVL